MSEAVALEVVVPVYNEVDQLDASVRAVVAHLEATRLPSWRVTIADNASTDGTDELGMLLAAEFDRVGYLRLEEKGRGRALTAAWTASRAEVVAYMDVDLSTDLAHLEELVAPLLAGDAQVAIGSRLAAGSVVERGPVRTVISHGYNLLLRGVLSVGFSDAQCGFKAVRRDVAGALLPLVKDTGWFFDTELLVLAERAGLVIHEVPVRWVDDPDSRVRLIPTIATDLAGTARLVATLDFGTAPLAAVAAFAPETPRPIARHGLWGQLLRFGIIGGVSTIAFAVLYLALTQVLASQLANFLALAITAVVNTAANRAYTFGVKGRHRAAGDHAQGFVLFLINWAITAVALGGLHLVHADAHAGIEVAVLTAANLVGTAVRFVLLRQWVFRPGLNRDPGRASAAVERA